MTVGVIGLGLLGSALAERFRRGGFALVGYDLDPARRLGADSAADVGRLCERVVLCLPDSDAVESALASAGLRPGQRVLDATTGDPERTAAVAAGLAGRGVGYVDAAVVGSSEQARAGDAVALVGGDGGDVAAVADLLRCFAREWFHLGPCGSGARMKLVVNLVLGLNRAALAEGLALARSCGIDPAEALRVLRAGAAYSKAMDAKGPKMVGRDFAPQAKLSQHLKDVELIRAEAARSGARVPLTEAHRELLRRAVELGHGGDDNSAVIAAFNRGP